MVEGARWRKAAAMDDAKVSGLGPLHRHRTRLLPSSASITAQVGQARLGWRSPSPASRGRKNRAPRVITPIIQFGTSRFLQAHVDLFVSDARAAGQDVGPITVVQTTTDAGRAGRLAAFDGRPIPVVIRGLESGRPV